MNKEEKLRVWWNSDFGKKPFTKEVKSVEKAKEIIQLLTEYDLYLGDKITSNACGLEEYVGTDVNYETNDGWIEWEDDNGNNIE